MNSPSQPPVPRTLSPTCCYPRAGGMLHTFWIYSELANTKPGITSLSTKTKQKHCLVGPRRVIRQVGNVRSHSSIPGRFMLTALCHLHCYGKVRLFYAAFLSLLSLLVMFNLSLGLVLLPLVKYFWVKPKRGIFSNPQLRGVCFPPRLPQKY